jgi:hypothetical protein
LSVPEFQFSFSLLDRECRERLRLFSMSIFESLGRKEGRAEVSLGVARPSRHLGENPKLVVQPPSQFTQMLVVPNRYTDVGVGITPAPAAKQQQQGCGRVLLFNVWVFKF